jgi:hypothetical protein
VRLVVAIVAAVAALALTPPAWASHTPVAAWGTPAPDTPGDAPGELKDPSGIDSDSFDNVYVADYGNNRVQKFTPDGELMTDWGTGGAVSGFNQPVDVAVTGGGVMYVADRAGNKVKRFDSTGGFLGEWTVAGPRAVATDGSGNVYVPLTSGGVNKYDATGVPDGTVPTFGLGEYTGIDITGTTVLVTDYDNDEVERWTTGGVFIDSWGSATLDGPSDVAVTEDGANVFVADSIHNRVQEFSLAGVVQPHTLGAGNGTLSNPQGVATGSLESVFVGDTEGNRVVKYADAVSGSTVRLSGTRLIFEGDGSDSIASVTLSGTEYTFTDTGDTVTRGAGCTQNGANSVKCDPSGVTVTGLRFLMGGGNDTVTATPTTPTSIEGGTGNDILAAGGGTNDVASYDGSAAAVSVSLGTIGPQATGAGTDTLTGFEGITGGDGADTLTGNGSANNLSGGDSDDVLHGEGGDDTLAGGAGTDTADYSSAVTGVTVNLSQTGAQATGGAGSDTLSSVENLAGSPQDDVLSGSSAANTIAGANGNDDIRINDSGPDTANCGAGTDVVTADSQDTANVDCETVTIAGSGGGGGGGGGGTPAPGPGSGGGGGATGPLVISGLGASKMRKGKPGTFRYTLSRAARVTLTIQRPGPGRKVGASCQKQTRKNRKKRKCTYYAPAGTLTHAGKAGANTVPFSGKPGGKALKPGSYRLTAVAVATTGAKSAPVTAKFTVTR